MRIAIFYIMAERTKHIHAQWSFRFVAERHKTLANRATTFAKRSVTMLMHYTQLCCVFRANAPGKRLVFQVVKLYERYKLPLKLEILPTSINRNRERTRIKLLSSLCPRKSVRSASVEPRLLKAAKSVVPICLCR